jgi:hypothetical protein
MQGVQRSTAKMRQATWHLASAQTKTKGKFLFHLAMTSPLFHLQLKEIMQ